MRLSIDILTGNQNSIHIDVDMDFSKKNKIHIICYKSIIISNNDIRNLISR